MKHEKLPSIKGSVPSLTELPSGCQFHPRCEYYMKGLCDRKDDIPQLMDSGSEHSVACFRWEEVSKSRKQSTQEIAG